MQAENGTVEESVARGFFKQIVETVLACHSKGVIHRDITTIFSQSQNWWTKVNILYRLAAFIEEREYDYFPQFFLTKIIFFFKLR